MCGIALSLSVSGGHSLSAQTANQVARVPQSGPAAQTVTPVALKGKLERIKVHGRSLEGNLMGESADPEVSIYLPPSYGTERNRRYPVVYLDLPTKNGEVQPDVAVKWAANSPVAMLDQYVPNLKKYKAIALDIGLQDGLITGNQLLVDRMKRFGIAHTFETYEGDHNNRIPQRLEEKVLPFFSKVLSFDQPRH